MHLHLRLFASFWLYLDILTARTFLLPGLVPDLLHERPDKHLLACLADLIYFFLSELSLLSDGFQLQLLSTFVGRGGYDNTLTLLDGPVQQYL